MTKASERITVFGALHVITIVIGSCLQSEIISGKAYQDITAMCRSDLVPVCIIACIWGKSYGGYTNEVVQGVVAFRKRLLERVLLKCWMGMCGQVGKDQPKDSSSQITHS